VFSEVFDLKPTSGTRGFEQEIAERQSRNQMNSRKKRKRRKKGGAAASVFAISVSFCG
jgi:hypothetical protein